jgi:hypothetical protein
MGIRRLDTAEVDAWRRHKRLEWASWREQAIDRLLTLAANNPSQFSASEWRAAETLVKELHGAAWFDHSRVLPPNRHTASPIVTKSCVRQVRTEFSRGLDALFPLPDKSGAQVLRWRPRGKASGHPVVYRHHEQVEQFTETIWPATVWVTIIGLLAEFGSRIRRCPDCPSRRFFVKTGRQAYCSRVCSQRVRSAKWYSVHRDAALEGRHEAYKRSVPRGHGTIVRRVKRRTGDTTSP